MGASTPRDAAVVLAVLLAAVLAGCSGLVDEPTPTVTPADVPTADPPRTPVPTVVPGVRDNGSVQPAAVVDAHERRLENHSFRFTLHRTIHDGTETRQETYVRTWVAAGGTPFRLVQFVNVSRQRSVATTSDRAVDLWYDGSGAFFRVTDSTGTPYVRAQSVGRETLTDPAFPDLHRELLASARFGDPDRSGEDGSVRLVADAFVDRSALVSASAGTDPANASLVLVVTPQGVVRVTRLAFDATLDGDRVRVVQRTRVSGLDGTRPPVPEWLSDDPSPGLNTTGVEGGATTVEDGATNGTDSESRE